jgi:hypothetical protein
MASAASTNLDLAVGEECRKTDLDTTGTRSQHPVAARSLPKVVAATWKVHQLHEILPTT